MSLETGAAIASGVFAGVGLIYAAIQIRSDKKIHELTLTESVFTQIQNLSEKLDEYQTKNEEEKHSWDFRFFNQLEWFSFLINEKKINDEKLIEFFKDAIIDWYDNIFLKHFEQDTINDEKEFPEFKKLYRKFKKT